MVDNRLNALLKDGFTTKMARSYEDTLLKEDLNPMFDAEFRSWAHSNGFSAETASALRLTDATKDNYLSDYNFYRVWPLNSWQRIWIDDKLTLKASLAGSEFDKYLPEYYFYAAKQGVVPIFEAQGKAGKDGFLGVLREKGEFAGKPANGFRGDGFCKLSYADGTYLINNQEATGDEVWEFACTHPNNVYTEFFHAGRGMEKISPVIHTLRVQTVNPTGVDPVFAAAYMRFATKVNADDSISNYRRPETKDICSFNTAFDIETGAFGDGKIVWGYKVEDAKCHPDTGVAGEGIFPDWAEAKQLCQGLAERFNLCEYMGFDISETPDGPKLVEINSHSGCKYLQVFKPFMTDAYLGDYFRQKLAALDAMDDVQRMRRNSVR